MNIVLTGGGSGGHFYPLIAISQDVTDMVENERIVKPNVYYFSPTKIDGKTLFENDIKYVHTKSAPLHVHSKIKSLFSLFIIFIGFLLTFFKLYKIYPDVVISKGGYGAVPTLLSARILRIPIIIHDSDSIPGRTTLWSAKFANKIAIGYESAIKFFDKKYHSKIAYVGNPLLKRVKKGTVENPEQFFDLPYTKPTLLILGGSSGAKNINDLIIDSLNTLLEDYQIIHQVGENNFEEIQKILPNVVENIEYKKRYSVQPFLKQLQLKSAISISKLVISRAGSNTLTLISNWNKPSIIIPIPVKRSRDQVNNAYSYSRKTGAVVIEESNMNPILLKNEIDKIINDKVVYAEMANGTKEFFIEDSGKKIAKLVIDILKKHSS